MTDVERTHRRRLRRGQRWWDLVSPLHSSDGGQTTRIAELALRHLDLRPGGRVLDVGCGSGAALPTLSAAVGPSGRVVGLDHSARMLARAQIVVERRGLQNVELRRADATRVDLGREAFDAVYAATSISAMPDVRAALRSIDAALRPGGTLFVFDVRLVPRGWSTPVVWALRGTYAAVAGWAGVDVLDAAREVFGDVRLPALGGQGDRRAPEAGWPPLTLFVATSA